MKLLTIDAPNKGRPGVLSSKGEVIDILRIIEQKGEGLYQWIPGSVREILVAGFQGLDVIKEIVDRVDGASDDQLEMLRQAGAIHAYAETPLLAAIPEPNLFLAAGANSKAHFEEMVVLTAWKDLKPPAYPSAFIKNQASLTGSGKPIIIPEQYPEQVDFEGEFAFVVGRPCYNVSVEEASDYIGGYTLVNDVSARNFGGEFMATQTVWEAPFAWERNLLGKQFPSFTPVGPVITTADEIDDPSNLHMTTRLNGEVMQSSSTDDLYRGIDELLAYFSQFYHFQPGDVISTGSPPGVGFARDPKVFMKQGDVVEVEIEEIGTLSNPVVNAG